MKQERIALDQVTSYFAERLRRLLTAGADRRRPRARASPAARRVPCRRSRRCSRRRLARPVIRLAERGGAAASGDAASASGGDATAGSEPAPYLPVPDGVRADRPGQRAGARRARRRSPGSPSQEQVGVLDVDGDASSSQAASRPSQDWQLDAAGRAPRSYYVHATVRNVGDERPRRAAAMPLYLLDGAQHAGRASTLPDASSSPCPSPAAAREASAPARRRRSAWSTSCREHGTLDRGQLPPDRGLQPDHLGRQGRPQPKQSRSKHEAAAEGRAQRPARRDRGSGAPTGRTMADARPADLADPRVADRRDPGGAGADGGHHQRGVPAAVRRAGRRPRTSAR